jgi:hypothetical protein
MNINNNNNNNKGESQECGKKMCKFFVFFFNDHHGCRRRCCPCADCQREQYDRHPKANVSFSIYKKKKKLNKMSEKSN